VSNFFIISQYLFKNIFIFFSFTFKDNSNLPQFNKPFFPYKFKIFLVHNLKTILVADSYLRVNPYHFLYKKKKKIENNFF